MRKLPSWSPADLSRQRRAVRDIAVRVEASRRRLQVARYRCVSEFRRLLAQPLGLVAAFALGVAVGGRKPPDGVEGARSKGAMLWPTFFPSLLKTLVLTALTYAMPVRPR
jgi:hypothetical protein